jgi:hypothetical protein
MMMLRFEVYRGTGHCCTRSELDRPSRRKLASSVLDDQRMTAREEEDYDAIVGGALRTGLEVATGSGIRPGQESQPRSRNYLLRGWVHPQDGS